MVNYIIEYTVLSKIDAVIKTGTIKVKNKESELAAKCSLEDFLDRKYEHFHKLVIHKCTEDIDLGDDTLNAFKDLFGAGDSNPFK